MSRCRAKTRWRPSRSWGRRRPRDRTGAAQRRTHATRYLAAVIDSGHILENCKPTAPGASATAIPYALNCFPSASVAPAQVRRKNVCCRTFAAERHVRVECGTLATCACLAPTTSREQGSARAQTFFRSLPRFHPESSFTPLGPSAPAPQQIAPRRRAAGTSGIKYVQQAARAHAPSRLPASSCR